MLCEAETGYIANFEVYTGKSPGLFIPELGATGSVVVRLTAPFQHQNYKIYTDRYYTSPLLSRHLLTVGIHSCGTVLTNRKQFPKVLIRRRKDMKRGDIDFLCSRDLSAVVWCDRAPLYFLSTFDNPHQTTTVKRKDKDGAVVTVSTCRIQLHEVHGWLRPERPTYKVVPLPPPLPLASKVDYEVHSLDVL